MTALALRAIVHHGSVLAAGFWIPSDDTGSAEQQVLALWDNGTEVRRWLDGYVVVLRAPRRVQAALGRATPLVRQGKWLLGAPVRTKEQELLPPGNLLLVQGGKAHCAELEQLPRVDPSTWLDVSEFTLALPRPRAAVATPSAAISPGVDAQTLFQATVRATDEDRARQQELLQALTALRQGAQVAKAGGRTQSSALKRAATGLLQRLVSWFAQRRPAAPAATQALARRGAPQTSLWERLMSAAARWLVSTRFGAYVSRKHAEYLQDLLSLLEQHNDEEVLRRAIPLGKGNAPGDETPSLSPPIPRSSFEISLGPRQTASSVGLATSLFEQLRRSYEQVFARLDAAGKHEQAAYFLAEILGEAERAVSYLERHGQFMLAAKLAEARELSPGLLVRQWFIAGQRDRAVMIAVRENAFDDAVLRLERAGDKREAAALRLLQAERLASAGQLVRAAEIAHRLESGTPLSLRWLELARAGGDVRGVALELSLDAGRFEAAHAALQPLFGGAAADQLPTLLHVAEEFARLNVEVARPLARELARELFAAAASDGVAKLSSAASNVAKFVGGAFKVDIPPVVSFTQASGGTERRYHYASTDAGTSAVHDVHRFGQYLLLALGEAGVVMRSRDGRKVAHFDLPAEALVASLDGSRLLSVAQRGNRLEVGRIDLASRKCERWCELEAVSFARRFDGQTWLVCTGGWLRQDNAELLQLDVLDTAPRILHRAPIDLEAPAILVDGQHVNLVGSAPYGSIERLRYELPKLTLRQRSVLVSFADGAESKRAAHERLQFFAGAAAAHADTDPAVYEHWVDDGLTDKEPHIAFGARKVRLRGAALHGLAELTVHGNYFALSLSKQTQVRLLLGARTVTDTYAEVQLDGASRAAVRCYDDLVLVGDSAGRVLGFDPHSGAPLLDLRA